MHFFDFTLEHGFNDVFTEITCRMAYKIEPARAQAMNQPAEPATIDIQWVKRVWPAKGGMTDLAGIVPVLYDWHSEKIIAAAMAAHEPDERDDDRRDDLRMTEVTL